MTLILTHPTKPPVRVFTREDPEYHPGLVYVAVQAAGQSKGSWLAEKPLLKRWMEWPDVAGEIEFTIGPGFTHAKQNYPHIPAALLRQMAKEPK